MSECTQSLCRRPRLVRVHAGLSFRRCTCGRFLLLARCIRCCFSDSCAEGNDERRGGSGDAVCDLRPPGACGVDGPDSGLRYLRSRPPVNGVRSCTLAAPVIVLAPAWFVGPRHAGVHGQSGLSDTHPARACDALAGERRLNAYAAQGSYGHSPYSPDSFVDVQCLHGNAPRHGVLEL